jgi:hypothetical protein
VLLELVQFTATQFESLPQSLLIPLGLGKPFNLLSR